MYEADIENIQAELKQVICGLEQMSDRIKTIQRENGSAQDLINAIKEMGEGGSLNKSIMEVYDKFIALINEQP